MRAKYTSYDGGFVNEPCESIYTFEHDGIEYSVIAFSEEWSDKFPDDDTIVAVPTSRLTLA